MTQLWNRFGSKAVSWATRKGLLIYDTNMGKIQYKRIQKAIDNNDRDDYLDHASDV